MHRSEAPPALVAALLGDWTGVLEYRDYSEPANSTRRVQLPTWLSIRTAPEGLFFDYVYDDGPSKTEFSHSALVIDAGTRTYKVIGTDSVIENYVISGLEALQDGHGTLMLTGSGQDNRRPADIRTTWIIRRNLLSWLEEVRPSGSSEAFVFRHQYVFVRATAPAKPPARP